MAEGIQIKNLPSTTTIKQGDTMTIVQDKQNKQLSLDVFANESDLGTLSVLENRCDEVKNKIEVDEYSAEITTSQSMSKIGIDDSGADLHENVLDGAFESCVLKGHTKYRDIDTGEILENFEESRNLELITVRMPILKAVGKNLFDGNLISGYYEDGTLSKIIGDNANLYKTIKLNLKKGTYTFSFEESVRFIRQLKDGVYGALGGDFTKFTTTLQTDGIYVLSFRKTDNTDFDLTQIQVEEGSVATSYEPYKTSILSCNEDVVLRGIGDVQDTLDCLTGEVTERIGENVLDDSAEISTSSLNSILINTMVFGIAVPDIKKVQTAQINDKFPSINSNTNDNNDYEHSYVSPSSERIWFFIDKSKLTENSINGVKQWLSQNPITIQYELATPIVSTIDVQGFPHAYKNGHIQLSSDSIEPSLTPTVTYKVPVSRMGQIASNTKSNLRQSIKLDQLEVLVYQSLINSEYENLLVQNSAESAASFRNLSVNEPKDGLYYMLKHLIEENQPVQNMLDKINLFYLYGLLSDEHYFDLLLGGEEDVY